ncbi:MAG: cupin domain-containing protein [Planctomycetota bacterium]|nr:cupin domain-containing protein [Planctomycetota bacterium]
MNFENAIAKVRFSSARPQCVHIHKGKAISMELLCMEPDQGLTVRSCEWLYYVITGTAAVTAGGKTTTLPTGQLAASESGETHTLACVGETRLVCLAVRQSS